MCKDHDCACYDGDAYERIAALESALQASEARCQELEEANSRLNAYIKRIHDSIDDPRLDLTMTAEEIIKARMPKTLFDSFPDDYEVN